ncbi:hypothetical protein FACS1894199_02310 [Bacteroidia bacterium]|nr:hypothetical protein FACS1894199_02310 [Bacteroidia bacterium]
MKTLLMILLWGVISSNIYAQKSYYQRAQEPDSILTVYLEEDTIHSYPSAFLVFKNNSSDSIVLVSEFWHFLDEFTPGGKSGFMMDFHFNGHSETPNWGENPNVHYVFSTGNYKGKSIVQPYSIVKYRIDVPIYGRKTNEECLVSFHLNYRYINLNKGGGRTVYIKTKDLNLEYLFRDTEKVY